MTIDTDAPSIFDTIVGRATIGDQLRRHARNQPRHTALAYFDDSGVCHERLTYGELNERVNRIARSLSELGVARGDAVGVMSPNSIEYVTTYLAAAKLGAVTTGINYNFREAEVVYQIQHAEPVALFVHPSLCGNVDAIREVIPSVSIFVESACSDGHVASRGHSTFEWVEAASLYSDSVSSEEPNSSVMERDPLLLVYTSGTEAFPKAVTIPHRNYAIGTTPAWSMGSQCEHDNLTGGIVRTHDRWLFLTPLHTIAGLGNLTIVLSVGATIILPAVTEAALAVTLIERERVTAMVQTPTFFLAAVQAPNFANANLSSVERLLTYGGTMPEAMIEGWNSKSERLMWATYWGQSELTQLGAMGWFRTMADVPERDPSWIGRPVGALELIIVDEHGTELGVNKAGEAWCRTPSVMLEYYKDARRTAEVFKDGWLHTGDIMRRDELGNLYFLDRRKDVIKTGGYNVSSQEVERMVYRHPDVVHVAVVGLPHEYWSEAVTAFVVRRPGAAISSQEILDLCKTRLVNYKVPKSVQFIDRLPVDGQGKVLKRELRRLHANMYVGRS